MKPEQIRIKVAEACGWKPEIMLRCHKCDTCYEAEQGKDYSAGVFCPECRSKGHLMVGVCHPEPVPGSELPNYPEDLNSCHEFEKTLTPEQCYQYNGHFCAILGGWKVNSGPENWPFHMTALQRCEAFLRVKGLWQESE